MEEALRQAEATHRVAERVARDDLAEHGERHVRVHVRNDAQHAIGALEDVHGRVERCHRFAALHREHHLVVLALDNRVHLAAVRARKARLARIAQLELVEVHERMHGRVEHVVAQEPERIGAPDGAVHLIECVDRLLEGDENLVRLLLVHDVPKPMDRREQGIGNGIEQRVGPLVSQEEGLGLVLRSADGGEMARVGVLSERVVRDDCRHSLNSIL